MNYQFDKEKISQHVVKYGVDVRPPISPDEDRTKLQDYANWLIQQFPEAFETMLSGPRELRVQRTFLLPDAKRVELPTFILSGRGPVLTFPERLYIDRPHELSIPDRDKVFRKAYDELRARFPERTVPRVGVVHEMVFDTEHLSSLDVIAGCLKHDRWRRQAHNLRIQIESLVDGKSMSIEIRPTYLQRSGQAEAPVTPDDRKYGVIVNVGVNNQQTPADLTRAEISDVLAFANDYVPDELIKFLNNEE
jgi:hypothetical protein